jgi:hypothetical protein
MKRRFSFHSSVQLCSPSPYVVSSSDGSARSLVLALLLFCSHNRAVGLHQWFIVQIPSLQNLLSAVKRLAGALARTGRRVAARRNLRLSYTRICGCGGLAIGYAMFVLS